MKIRMLLFAFFFKVFAASALTTSVIIPCYPGHVKYLPEVLTSLSEQTVLPDEIVISFSEIEKVSPSDIKFFLDFPYPFALKIVSNSERLFAGQNRNKACSIASGDIFICQDADDIPHPQRIEIIKYFFEISNIDLLIHKYMFNTKDFYWDDYEKEKITLHLTSSWNEMIKFHSIHYGNISYKREVFDSIKYPDLKNAEDVKFINMAADKGFSIGIIQATLLNYRRELTSGNGN